MNVNKPSQLQIAQALGLSQASIVKYKRRGMPMESTDAAATWHRAHVKITAHRIPQLATPAQSAPPDGSNPEAARAVALLDLAAKALTSGHDIGAMVPELRQALRAVPDVARAGMLVPVRVFDLLTGDVRAALQDDETGNDQVAQAMPDDEAAAMGEFWYRCAAGEIRPA